LPQYRARLVRDVLSQDSDVLFGCERRESLNERTRTRIASAHEVLVSLSLGGWQDYNKGQNIPRITAVTNAKAKMYQPIFARGATTSRSLSNASVAASSSKIRMRRSVCDRPPGLAATRSQKYVPRDSALRIPPHAIFLKQSKIDISQDANYFRRLVSGFAPTMQRSVRGMSLEFGLYQTSLKSMTTECDSAR